MKKSIALGITQSINKTSYSFEHALDPTVRRQTGSYYTSISLTIPMAEELINSLPAHKRENLHHLRFLEPCVGTGNFVFAYILSASSNLNDDQIIELLDNIYVCDINKDALDLYKEQLRLLAKDYFGIELNEPYFQKHIGRGLLFDVTTDTPKYISIDDVFGKGSSNSFDIIMTNPPYKNLKAEVGHYKSESDKSKDRTKYNKIAQLSKHVLPLTSYGTLNLYKLFVEEIINRYASRDGIVSLLIPSSILTDKTCERIRSKIINNHHIVSIKNIPENNKFIDAQQALTAILIDKNTSINENRLTNIYKAYSSKEDESAIVDIKSLATKDNGYTILALSNKELEALQKMSRFPKIKNLPFIVNLRGELDLTANRDAITNIPTKYRLLRGRNIGYYKTIDAGEQDFTYETFVDKSAKGKYVHNPRLVCQQISNMSKERRLTFARVQPDHVLANSCNFIAVRENNAGVDINYLAGILNSKLMNWYFKIHSSNNHINNYEIDNFPIPINGNEIKAISDIVARCEDFDEDTLNKIDSLVGKLFGTTSKGDGVNKEYKVKATDEIENRALNDLRCILPQLQLLDVHALLTNKEDSDAIFIKYAPSLSKFDINVFRGIVIKYKKISSNTILNHTTFKLSDLDLEMIRPIPQGGNWKNIPDSTVRKSRRLKRITETGGRTTLYGRLHYQKPSYTITTYFNRPGNGTYVHPAHNRVLSVREAARLQSFSDDYYFYGNKTQLLKQIGNAVPALLAYQIGTKIIDRLGPVKSLDLFCGAGGLTSGFRKAGIETILCTDYDEAACTTIKINNPESQVICGDITDITVKNAIVESAITSRADIVCGGPPCQGFSMAGYRNENDPRNQLFKEFVAVVETTRPKVVLFENVEGILTFQNGETYKAIHQLFSELGYKTEGRLLKIDRFGVPQKRKRVIIICTREDIDVEPAELYPDEITLEDSDKVTVADSIRDLENIACTDDAQYSSDTSSTSTYNKMLQGSLAPSEFLSSLKTRNKLPVVSPLEQMSLI